jgi:flagellar assembly factor FliW
MDIKTASFGTQSVSEDDLIHFPDGMVGFPEQTQFKLFHEENNEQPNVYWLQSATDADFIMSIVAPSMLGLNYQITLSDEETESLELDNPEDAAVVLAIYKQFENDNDSIDIKAVAKAPIIINTNSKKGLQKLLPSLDLTVAG